MNYFSLNDLYDFPVQGTDYGDQPRVGEPFFTPLQAADLGAQSPVPFERGRVLMFEFSVIHEDGTVTVHQGQIGRDDRVLI